MSQRPPSGPRVLRAVPVPDGVGESESDSSSSPPHQNRRRQQRSAAAPDAGGDAAAIATGAKRKTSRTRGNRRSPAGSSGAAKSRLSDTIAEFFDGEGDERQEQEPVAPQPVVQESASVARAETLTSAAPSVDAISVLSHFPSASLQHEEQPFSPHPRRNSSAAAAEEVRQNYILWNRLQELQAYAQRLVSEKEAVEVRAANLKEDLRKLARHHQRRGDERRSEANELRQECARLAEAEESRSVEVKSLQSNVRELKKYFMERELEARRRFVREKEAAVVEERHRGALELSKSHAHTRRAEEELAREKAAKREFRVALEEAMGTFETTTKGSSPGQGLNMRQCLQRLVNNASKRVEEALVEAQKIMKPNVSVGWCQTENLVKIYTGETKDVGCQAKELSCEAKKFVGHAKEFVDQVKTTDQAGDGQSLALPKSREKCDNYKKVLGQVKEVRATIRDSEEEIEDCLEELAMKTEEETSEMVHATTEGREESGFKGMIFSPPFLSEDMSDSCAEAFWFYVETGVALPSSAFRPLDRAQASEPLLLHIPFLSPLEAFFQERLSAPRPLAIQYEWEKPHHVATAYAPAPVSSHDAHVVLSIQLPLPTAEFADTVAGRWWEDHW